MHFEISPSICIKCKNSEVSSTRDKKNSGTVIKCKLEHTMADLLTVFLSSVYTYEHYIVTKGRESKRDLLFLRLFQINGIY